MSHSFVFHQMNAFFTSNSNVCVLSVSLSLPVSFPLLSIFIENILFSRHITNLYPDTTSFLLSHSFPLLLCSGRVEKELLEDGPVKRAEIGIKRSYTSVSPSSEHNPALKRVPIVGRSSTLRRIPRVSPEGNGGETLLDRSFYGNGMLTTLFFLVGIENCTGIFPYSFSLFFVLICLAVRDERLPSSCL